MERNYHIFYCLLSGMPKEQKNVLSLSDATQFNYLTEVWTSEKLPQIILCQMELISQDRLGVCSYDANVAKKQLELIATV